METGATGWIGQDAESFAAKVTKAFHEAKKQAIKENLLLFGRADGAALKQG